MINSQLSKISVESESQIHLNTKASNNQPLIMVVEDNTDSRLMLRIMLEIWKYRVVEARSGAEAIATVKQMNPDLILMDIGLPDMDGFDATREIRRFASLDSLPIIYLSGYPISQAEYVGGNDYLVKPFDVNELENLLNIYTENCRARCNG
jgi:CheY-like chemotaxis protein